MALTNSSTVASDCGASSAAAVVDGVAAELKGLSADIESTLLCASGPKAVGTCYKKLRTNNISIYDSTLGGWVINRRIHWVEPVQQPSRGAPRHLVE